MGEHYQGPDAYWERKRIWKPANGLGFQTIGLPNRFAKTMRKHLGKDNFSPSPIVYSAAMLQLEIRPDPLHEGCDQTDLNASRGFYRLADVAAHCQPDDCWVVIGHKVYDVTQFLSEVSNRHRTSDSTWHVS